MGDTNNSWKYVSLKDVIPPLNKVGTIWINIKIQQPFLKKMEVKFIGKN